MWGIVDQVRNRQHKVTGRHTNGQVLPDGASAAAGRTGWRTSSRRRPAEDGVRHLVEEDRRHLYFDGLTAAPMPSSHYAGVTYLRTHPWRGPERLEFRGIGGHAPFDVRQVEALMARRDRQTFNIPDGLRGVRAQFSWLGTSSWRWDQVAAAARADVGASRAARVAG
jgi:hypothetical protein